MRTNPGSSQQVHVTQMLRPLAQALDAALERHASESKARGKAPAAGAI
jgi:hypothetical protein